MFFFVSFAEAYSGLPKAADGDDAEADKQQNSGSDNEEDEEQSAIAKYRQLLMGGLSEDKPKKKKSGSGHLEEEPDMEMEISWEPGIKVWIMSCLGIWPILLSTVFCKNLVTSKL